MKIIKVYRYGSKNPLTLKNGDKYDSAVEIIDDNGAVEYRSELVNTDPSVKHSGGIIAEGVYRFICDYHQGQKGKTPYKAIILYNNVSDNRNAAILTKADLTLTERTFVSKVDNPVHDGKAEISCVNFHRGGYNEDVSEGCLTMHPSNWIDFISHFDMGEKGKLEIILTAKRLILEGRD